MTLELERLLSSSGSDEGGPGGVRARVGVLAVRPPEGRGEREGGGEGEMEKGRMGERVKKRQVQMDYSLQLVYVQSTSTCTTCSCHHM